MKTPRSVDLLITGRCNLRCSYCSHFTSGSDVQDLPAGEWLRFFEELGGCSVMDVCLQGGEPFIREDFKELIQGVVGNRMRFSILSNGTLITEDLASFIASTGRCNSVQISIDGSAARINDACRGEGTFRRAAAGLRLLLKYELPATVRVTINRENVRDLAQIARMLLEDFGLPGFSTNSASYLGLCRKNTEQVQLTTQERVLAMECLGRLITEYNGRISATAGPLAEARAWAEMERSRLAGLKASPGYGILSGCNGPMEKIGVRADGVIVPCVQMPAMVLGRINDDDFETVWNEHPELNRFRKRRDLSLEEFEFCRGCDYIPYCTGNCPASNHTGDKDAYHPSTEGCLKRFLENGGTLPLDGY
ncbi:MAG: SynChlorMet cassette radical SAM/SPASM protein ScmE [Pseudomonadota bacterium]